MFELWPFTNFHDMNLDWIIKKIRNVEDSEANAKASEEAAADSASASAGSAGRALLHRNAAKDFRDEAQGFANDAQDTVDSISAVTQQIQNNTDRIDNLVANAGDTDGNAELLDIRVAYDGVTYPTAGDAVRAQALDLANAIYPVIAYDTEAVTGTLDYGKYFRKSGTGIAVETGTNYSMLTADVTNGDMLNVYCSIGSDATWTIGCAFLDTDDHIVKQYNKDSGSTTFEKLVVKVPTGAVKLVVNAYGRTPGAEKLTPVPITTPYDEAMMGGFSVRSVSMGDMFGAVSAGGINKSGNNYNEAGSYDASHYRTGFRKLNGEGTYKIFCNEVGGVQPWLRVYYYNDSFQFQSDSGWNTSVEITPADYKNKYVRIGLSTVGDVAFTPADAMYTITLEYVPYNADAVVPTKLTVGTYNIGHFAMGTSSDPEGTDEMKPFYRNLLSSMDCDIIGITENDTFYDADGTETPYNEVYAFYEYYSSSTKNGYDCNAILSNYELLTPTKVSYTAQGWANRSYYRAHANIEGKDVVILTTQLEWSDKDVRRAQITQLITEANQHDYVIILGDMNPDNRTNGAVPAGESVLDAYETDYAMWTSAGYKVANTGYFGSYNTLAPNEGTAIYPWDNIITSSNMMIQSTSVIKNDTLTDHYPIIANIVMY